MIPVGGDWVPSDLSFACHQMNQNVFSMIASTDSSLLHSVPCIKAVLHGPWQKENNISIVNHKYQLETQREDSIIYTLLAACCLTATLIASYAFLTNSTTLLDSLYGLLSNTTSYTMTCMREYSIMIDWRGVHYFSANA